MSPHAALDTDAAPNKPVGHVVHAPAWTAPMPEHVVLEQVAVQYPDGHAQPDVLREPLERAVTLEHGPGQVDRATYSDPHGSRNDILLCYWTDPHEHRRWAAQPDVARLWSGAHDLGLGVGRWRELLQLQGERLETLDSAGVAGRGFSALGDLAPTGVHEYWGAMRDRISASHTDPLNGDAVAGPRAAGRRESQPRKLTLRAPENVCFIRTGQDWSHTRGQQRETYEQTVAPVLEQGADFLRDHPDETGCLSSRLVREMDADWQPQDRSCVLAYFRSLGHLERWTWSHPTHMAIFDAFMGLVSQAGGDVQLRLWHEVAVLTSDTLGLEYLSCHPDTGLLATLGRDDHQEEDQA